MSPWASLCRGNRVDQFDDANAISIRRRAAGIASRRTLSPGWTPYASARVRLRAQVEDWRRLSHHAQRRVEAAHARAKVQVVRTLSGVEFVHIAQHDLLELLQSHRAGRGPQVRDRFVAGHDADALVVRREKMAVPDLSAGVRGVFRQHDERREIAIQCAEAEAEPRAEARQGNRR